MIRGLSIFLIFFPSLLWPVNKVNFDNESISKITDCSQTNTAFNDKEHLVYQVYFNWGLLWLNVAQVTFNVNETKEGYFITAIGDTYSKYEWLYNVYDEFEVMVDKSTLLPKWSIKKTHENDYLKYEKKIFNQSGKYVESYEGKDKFHLTKKVIPVDDCAQDLLSSLYFVRNFQFQNYRKGKLFDLNIFMDEKLYKLQARYDGSYGYKEVKGLGTFNTIRLSPETVAGQVFSSDKGSFIYATNDLNRIPVIIETKLKVGSLKVILHSAKNLRNPFTSRVE